MRTQKWQLAHPVACLLDPSSLNLSPTYACSPKIWVFAHLISLLCTSAQLCSCNSCAHAHLLGVVLSNPAVSFRQRLDIFEVLFPDLGLGWPADGGLSAIEDWMGRMKEVPAVKRYLCTTGQHVRYAADRYLTDRRVEPDFDMLVTN